MFEVTNNADGTVNIANVPIFKTHADRRYNCDESWLDRCVADFMGQKLESLDLAEGDARYAMLPSLTIGHTPEDPNAPEPDNHGFLDNVRRVGRLLYADLMHVSREAWAKIKSGKLPYRSAEVIPSKHRITNLSLLGGRYPHFALPVMRFRSRQHGEILRYTFKTKDTAMPAPAAANPELLQIAELLAPMVADIMANKQANAIESDASAAGTADPEQASDTGDAGGDEGFDDSPLEIGGPPEDEESDSDFNYSARGVQRTTMQRQTTSNGRFQPNGKPARIDRHGGGTVSASGKRGEGFKNDSFRPNTEGNEAPMNGSDLGTTNPAKSADRNLSEGYSAKISQLTRENQGLKETIQRLSAEVGQIQRHQMAEAQASKRIMLRSKVMEIGSRYAIGDKDAVERHVERMMGMDVNGVKSYITDVLKASPRIAPERQSYGSVHDVVRRPGSEDDAEQYVAENRERVQKLGLDASILRLADALGGDA